MPVYQYDNNSLIDEVTIIKNASGGQRAYLHAREDLSAEQLAGIAKKLGENHFLSVPYKYNGKPVLEVRGFGKEDILLNTLRSGQLLSGKPAVKKIDEDRVSLVERFKANSLWLVALIYIAGDIGFMNYEHKQAKKKKREGQEEDKPDAPLFEKIMGRVGGLGYFAGSLTMLGSLMAGKDTAEDEIQKASQKAIEAAMHAGIAISEEEALTAFANQKDNRSQLAKNFSKYPSELMNLSFAAAGVGISYTAHKDLQKLKAQASQNPFIVETDDYKKEKAVAQKDRILGAITTASGIGGTAFTEKHHDPNKPRKKGIAGAIEWLTEKPLRVAGYGYMVSTVIHVFSSFQDRNRIKVMEANTDEEKKAKKDDLAGNNSRLFFVIVSLIAEIIITLSSKGHGKGVKSDSSVDPTTCAMVADMIHKKPKEMQPELIEKMSDFLSMPEALGTNQDELKGMINAQLAELDKNPWAQSTQDLKPTMPVAEIEMDAAESVHPTKALEKKPHPRINNVTQTGINASLS